MLYAIIAAGEGSRLSSEGYVGLKPMVNLNGEMMIDRLINIFIENGADAISIIINESSNELETYLNELKASVKLNIIKKTTESSLHSFYELLEGSEHDGEVCLTTTDTIFDRKEFKDYIQTFKNSTNIDGLLAVTSYIEDESPLYVDFDKDSKKVTQITDEPAALAPFVSGGIYCLRNKALKNVHIAIETGVHRMRNFQRLMLENGSILNAYPFSKIMDVDHVADIEKAASFLNEIEL